MRLDKKLCLDGLTATRSQAQLLIKEGSVFINGKAVLKSSYECSEQDQIEVRKEHQFVGRGAHKIEGAHQDFNLSFKDKIIADVGASTGGFTEYALMNEAKKVYAIDVGRDQLAQKLREHPLVENLEGVNIRYGIELAEKVDLAVVDLSYISLKLCLLPIKDLCQSSGEIVALVKPQFEVGKDNIGKNGIVKSEKVALASVRELALWCRDNGLGLVDAKPCRIAGKTGNQEYFFYFKMNEVTDEKNGRLLWLLQGSES